jgi:hypothetical protein
MIFPHNIIHKGRIYKAGEEVPEEGTSIEYKEEVKTTAKTSKSK